ncbi:hypothetical protein IIB34_00870, partial [PVC group bacterium]|nr:hypothetical protein [PVC group bacterium]
MKKLVFLIFHKDREEVLSTLQDIGVIHIEEHMPSSQPEDITRTETEIKRTQRVLLQLKRLKKHEAPENKEPLGDASHVLEKFEALENKEHHTDHLLLSLEKDIKILEPWGDFNTHLMETLVQSGIRVRFFE